MFADLRHLWQFLMESQGVAEAARHRGGEVDPVRHVMDPIHVPRDKNTSQGKTPLVHPR